MSDPESLGLHTDKWAHDEKSHFQQFKYEDIRNGMFLKVNSLPHATAIMGAFDKNHSYKTIGHPSFAEGFLKDMEAQGIPGSQQKKAVDAVYELVKEFGGDKERDYGWNPNMDDLVDLTSNADDRNPERSVPFNNEEPLRATEVDADYEQL